jgi:anti-sigma factor RsiW
MALGRLGQLLVLYGPLTRRAETGCCTPTRPGAAIACKTSCEPVTHQLLDVVLFLTPLLALLCISDWKGKKGPLLSTWTAVAVSRWACAGGWVPAVSRRGVITMLKAEKRRIRRSYRGTHP